MPDLVAILDFGSQYTQLIARRVREQHVYSEILPHDTAAAELRRRDDLRGIILSGGPAGVYDANAPRCDAGMFHLGVPVLGICYGMQLACEEFGGRVQAARTREYGSMEVELSIDDPLFEGLEPTETVWMSHGDRVEELPDSLVTIARTSTCPHAAVLQAETRFRGLQFHPEVTHTPHGRQILANFLFRVCGCSGDWSLPDFTEQQIEAARSRVGDDHLVCALSGGVDSSVVALLLHRALGPRLHCIFVDNGLLRREEREQVERTFRETFHIDLHVVDAVERFLEGLRGVLDPEQKRRVIGRVFIEVFEEEARSLPDVRYLAQGTLYPDVIESTAPGGGPAAKIKSHHNVGGLPEKLHLDLVEPLRFLFKDEVREIGRQLGLPARIIDRQPFPGPGLAVRIVGEVTPKRLDMLREADAIVQDEIGRYHDYRRIWQSFAVLLPVQTVGVMGDQRTYEHVVALRVVESSDGMTADWVQLPRGILSRISNRICNEVHGVNRVVLDVSSKPPSTIEWE